LALKRPLVFARKPVGLRQKAGGAQSCPFWLDDMWNYHNPSHPANTYAKNQIKLYAATSKFA